ncbi:MAG: N-6 DNA methylase [Phycisphaerae bacterium]|nr:N-6 DNA methylase [Phycisphaerae bacterium]
MWDNDKLSNLEAKLWDSADELRANSKLTSGEYFFPVMGVIFLRHAQNRFDNATRQIEEDRVAGRMPKRAAIKADYIKRRALWLPEIARYDYLLNLPSDEDLGAKLVEAMNAIEEDFEPLKGQLPKEYGIFERDVLEQLLKNFNHDALRTATGDVFGRIYEYFLMKFSMQKAYDNGEFFTPPSIVQTIVNVIEPDHGIVFDPATGSGGMFVQTSHFVENQGQDTTHAVTFYGQEKTRGTIPLAKMNLAVHALEGAIQEANTFYEDVHTLVGKCDFVMANPPFNVDKVDAKRVKGDVRLPFGLPGVNQQNRVSNGNYLWISYFHSYLNEKGRAGFVMSSQASSAGHGEKEVRRKIVETGDVDVMIAIRSNFFYTRSVPCELWHFDKGKPKDRRDKVLMIDARHIYRKVTRKIYDFAPEQLKNIAAIVWLYRGQDKRYLKLTAEYLQSIADEAEKLPGVLALFDEALGELSDVVNTAREAGDSGGTPAPSSEIPDEYLDARNGYEADRDNLLKSSKAWNKAWKKFPSLGNAKQIEAQEAFAPIAEECRGLVRQVDLVVKLAARMVDALGGTPAPASENGDNGPRGRGPSLKEAKRRLKVLDAQRKEGVEQLKRAAYFHRQVHWLQSRFPNAEFADVEGLCKRVDQKRIEANDWSLTPGRYVGVAPQEEDEDFDFEETLREIHVELADLNKEAVDLAKQIQTNFEELGV